MTLGLDRTCSTLATSQPEYEQRLFVTFVPSSLYYHYQRPITFFNDQANHSTRQHTTRHDMPVQSKNGELHPPCQVPRPIPLAGPTREGNARSSNAKQSQANPPREKNLTTVCSGSRKSRRNKADQGQAQPQQGHQSANQPAVVVESQAPQRPPQRRSTATPQTGIRVQYTAQWTPLMARCALL